MSSEISPEFPPARLFTFHAGPTTYFSQATITAIAENIPPSNELSADFPPVSLAGEYQLVNPDTATTKATDNIKGRPNRGLEIG